MIASTALLEVLSASNGAIPASSNINTYTNLHRPRREEVATRKSCYV